MHLPIVRLQLTDVTSNVSRGVYHVHHANCCLTSARLIPQVPDVKGRDWRLFRKNLISRYGEDNGKDPWGEGCWAHEIGTVEPVRREDT